MKTEEYTNSLRCLSKDEIIRMLGYMHGTLDRVFENPDSEKTYRFMAEATLQWLEDYLEETTKRLRR